MSFIFAKNIFIPLGFAEFAVFPLKELLKAAGWTVPRSSDGITYNPSGDILTTPVRGGAGSFGNDLAWFVVRSPDGHEWMFQRGSGVDPGFQTWTIAVSRAAGFITGATSVVAPTAADQGIMITPSTPWDVGGNGVHCRFNICAENVAPYRFWAAPLANQSYQYLDTRGVLSMDTMAVTAVSALDADPFVYTVSIFGSPRPYAYWAAGTPNQRFSALNTFYDGFVGGSDHFNGRHNLTGIAYADLDRGRNLKGMSTLFRSSTIFRDDGTLLKDTVSGDRIVVMSGFVAPWDGSLPRRDL